MISIERKTTLADNKKRVVIEHSYRNPTSIKVGMAEGQHTPGASLTDNEEKAAIISGTVVGLGMIGGALYAASKGKYFLGVLTFVASGPVAVMTTAGLAYYLYRNDSTGV